MLALHVGGLSPTLENEVDAAIRARSRLSDLEALAPIGLAHPALEVPPAQGSDRVEVLVGAEQATPAPTLELADQAQEGDQPGSDRGVRRC